MKRSGFSVRITAFIEADAKDPASIVLATEKIKAAIAAVKNYGFVCIEDDSRFMLSREVPDEPKAAEPVSLDIPAPLRRA